MEITIDGKRIEATEGETILSVAVRAGIYIPTLCHHDALEPVGACRLCSVEINRNGLKRIVTSCQFPVEAGLEVSTNSQLVTEQRQTILSLLLARCPDVEMIRVLAARYGAVTQYETTDTEERCIVCYLCTRVCAVIGREAISAVGRGRHKEMVPPFHGVAEACVACGACHRICPTGCIQMDDDGNTRRIWGREFERATCEVCGAPTAITKAYRDYAIGRQGLDASYFATCATCRAKEAAMRFCTVGKIPGVGE